MRLTAGGRQKTMSDFRGDVVVIGSGMGGGTTPWRWPAGVWTSSCSSVGSGSPARRRTGRPGGVRRSAATSRPSDGSTAAGVSSRPGVHYVVGGNTKVYGASLPRFREHDFGAVEHREGTSPCVAVHATPTSSRTTPRRSASTACTARPERTPASPGGAPRSPIRLSRMSPMSPTSRIGLRAAGRAPQRGRDGHRPARGRGLHPLRDLRRLPCQVGAKSDAETCALDPAIATGTRTPDDRRTGRRIVTDASGRRVEHLIVEARGPRHHRRGPVRAGRRRRQLRGLLLMSACEPSARAGECIGPGRAATS